MANPTIHKVLDPILRTSSAAPFQAQAVHSFHFLGPAGLVCCVACTLVELFRRLALEGLPSCLQLSDFRRLAAPQAPDHLSKTWLGALRRSTPSLQSTLITALDQEPNPETGKYHYLQEQVIRKALSSNLKEPWITRSISDSFFQA